MGVSARELVKQLLTDDPVARLEIQDIKQHPFFKNTNWRQIQQRQIHPPFVPDMSHLDQYKSNDMFADVVSYYKTGKNNSSDNNL